MPANLTPDYKAAETRYKTSRDPAERLDALREMLRLIPKHKGTDHLQADIKSRIKELTEELAGPRKGAARTGPPTVIRPEGAGQISLLGPPNSGKSALHARLTGSHTASEPYPFATQYPQPGMLHVDDVMIQLIDLPSVSPLHPIPWMANAVQPADGAMLVVDLTVPGCVEATADVIEVLRERRVTLIETWPAATVQPNEDDRDTFGVYLPTLVVATKADLMPNVEEELAVFLELEGYHYPSMAVSATTGAGLEAVGHWLFRQLGVVRVYTKEPGSPPDMGAPFTVREGDTVIDVAAQVHRDFVRDFKYARIWGKGGFDGQQVGRDHVVDDGDVLELHT